MKSTKQVIKELKQEKAELSEKAENLAKFLSNEKLVAGVGEHHEFLMYHQLNAMECYIFWLEKRICDLERKLKK